MNPFRSAGMLLRWLTFLSSALIVRGVTSQGSYPGSHIVRSKRLYSILLRKTYV